MAAGLASVGARGLWLTGSRAVRLGVAAILAVAVAGSLGTAALAVKSTAKAVLGLESERQYLERNSWNYPAFEEIDRLLPADAKVAAIGPVNNLYYAKRSAVFLGFGERSAAELRAAGFTHELLAGSCPLHGVRAGRTTLAEGSYPLRASRLGGGEYARLCYRLAALDVHGPVP
jgi:hypothetical protein